MRRTNTDAQHVRLLFGSVAISPPKWRHASSAKDDNCTQDSIGDMRMIKGYVVLSGTQQYHEFAIDRMRDRDTVRPPRPPVLALEATPLPLDLVNR